ncbi:hypothetical protein [Aliikangiella sp. G2MR2-5]|uniref:hypothetical protein n=1 Tax=Aliikangiella sp. G2MR2-5 TaxID=2788943 RepID=UPI0018A96D8F|nr:hypothetical protein [Aliikangiella sp. G2MR2-5]
MKKLIPVALVVFSGLAVAGEDVVYTSDEYCAKQGVSQTKHDKQYLKAYSEKLGFEHSKRFCREVNKDNRIAQSNRKDRKWEYAFNKPYRGSAIRLSKRQIEKLKAAGVDFSNI